MDVNLLAKRCINLLMDNAYTETQDNGFFLVFKCSTCKYEASHFHVLHQYYSLFATRQAL